jgi:hypothetical protein
MSPTNPFPDENEEELQTLEGLLKRPLTVQDRFNRRYMPENNLDEVDARLARDPYTSDAYKQGVEKRFLERGDKRIENEQYYDEAQYLGRGERLGLNSEYKPKRPLSIDEIKQLGAPNKNALLRAITEMMLGRE